MKRVLLAVLASHAVAASRHADEVVRALDVLDHTLTEFERRGACSGNLLAGNICCASQCGDCTEEGCSDKPGGQEECCPSYILEQKTACIEDSDMGCVVASAPDTQPQTQVTVVSGAPNWYYEPGADLYYDYLVERGLWRAGMTLAVAQELAYAQAGFAAYQAAQAAKPRRSHHAKSSTSTEASPKHTSKQSSPKHTSKQSSPKHTSKPAAPKPKQATHKQAPPKQPKQAQPKRGGGMAARVARGASSLMSRGMRGFGGGRGRGK